MASARAEAIAAMLAPHVDGTSDDALRAITLGESLDAIPASVHARLAIGRGGLEQVDPMDLLNEEPLLSWLSPPASATGPVVVNKRPPAPVYRLTEETPRAGGNGDVRHVAQPGRCAAPYQRSEHSSVHECNRRVGHGTGCRCRCGDDWFTGTHGTAREDQNDG